MGQPFSASAKYWRAVNRMQSLTRVDPILLLEKHFRVVKDAYGTPSVPDLVV